VLVCKTKHADGTEGPETHHYLGGVEGHGGGRKLGEALGGMAGGVGGGPAGTGLILQAYADRVCGPSVQPYKDSTIGLGVSTFVLLVLFIVFAVMFARARRR
jgi:hypothetical protein